MKKNIFITIIFIVNIGYLNKIYSSYDPFDILQSASPDEADFMRRQLGLPMSTPVSRTVTPPSGYLTPSVHSFDYLDDFSPDDEVLLPIVEVSLPIRVDNFERLFAAMSPSVLENVRRTLDNARNVLDNL